MDFAKRNECVCERVCGRTTCACKHCNRDGLTIASVVANQNTRQYFSIKHIDDYTRSSIECCRNSICVVPYAFHMFK